MGDTKLFDLPAQGDGIIREARFSEDGKHRLLLSRRWSEENTLNVLFVMLNPSTANAEKDDPTVRKCIAFAKCWGCGAMHVMNLFDYITPSPNALLNWVEWEKRTPGAKKFDADDMLIYEQSRSAALTVCGWGTWGGWFPDRAIQVYRLLSDPHALRITKDGDPGHPLYLPAKLSPEPFKIPTKS